RLPRSPLSEQCQRRIFRHKSYSGRHVMMTAKRISNHQILEGRDRLSIARLGYNTIGYFFVPTLSNSKGIDDVSDRAHYVVSASFRPAYPKSRSLALNLRLFVSVGLEENTFRRAKIFDHCCPASVCELLGLRRPARCDRFENAKIGFAV